MALELETNGPTVRCEPSGSTVEGRRARSTLQSGGRSLEARGSSRNELVDDGFRRVGNALGQDVRLRDARQT